jgi:hypothetical protein
VAGDPDQPRDRDRAAPAGPHGPSRCHEGLRRQILRGDPVASAVKQVAVDLL